MTIPKITNERIADTGETEESSAEMDAQIAELLKTIRPIILRDGIPHVCDPVDPRGVSFTWDPKNLVPAPFVTACGTIRTLHTFGHYMLFKPSIAEVLAQIPDPTGIVGFSIVGPTDAIDLNRESEALNAGFHAATTTLYRSL